MNCVISSPRSTPPKTKSTTSSTENLLLGNSTSPHFKNIINNLCLRKRGTRNELEVRLIHVMVSKSASSPPVLTHCTIDGLREVS
ncbi:hypothetical protein NC651_024662 [Populus alba x Populus x berolinensis]|nr:hypothetical protein NC651_024662 [Populus alba x Populus x berolinensis]